MNRKLLFLDVFLFFIGIMVLVVCLLFENHLSKNIALSIALTSLCLILIVICMFFSYKNTLPINIVNIGFPFFMMIITYIAYNLPLFDFVGKKGVQNSICLLFLFTFFSRFVMDLSEYLKIKSNYLEYKVIGSTNRLGKNSTNGLYIFSRGLRIYSICIFIVALIGAEINAFYPVVDMSIPYQVMFMHKDLLELISNNQSVKI